jgi:multidrug efflux system membrane fusion protein
MRLNPSYVAALLIGVGVALWLGSGQIRSSDRVQAAAPPPPAAEPAPRAVRVRVSQAEDRVETVRILGLTQASRRLELKAEIDGRVAETRVERGARVEAGAVIVQLAAEDRPQRRQEAAAILAQRQAESEQARTLAARGFRAEISVSETQARLESARAGLARMDLELGRLAVRAPFAGVVESRPVELGSYLQPGSPVAMIVALDPIRFVAHVSERDATRVTAGAAVRVRIGERPPIAASIVFVSAVADLATRTFRVEAEAPNPDLALVEGLSAELLAPIGVQRAHRIAPSLISLADDGRIGVKLVEGEQARFAPVRIAAAGADGLWVTGLPDRATLITVGQDFVTDGQRVRAVPDGAQ